jgi:hypothetical protein
MHVVRSGTWSCTRRFYYDEYPRLIKVNNRIENRVSPYHSIMYLLDWVFAGVGVSPTPAPGRAKQSRLNQLLPESGLGPQSFPLNDSISCCMGHKLWLRYLIKMTQRLMQRRWLVNFVCHTQEGCLQNGSLARLFAFLVTVSPTDSRRVEIANFTFLC